ncbi:hypothetical protein J3A83DRAFT_4222488 [Scleroderma citrinum]
MLAGSTLGLGLSSASSSLPCQLRQAQQLFVRGQFMQCVRPSRHRVVQLLREGEKDVSGHHSERNIGSTSVGKSGATSSVRTPSPLKRTRKLRAGGVPRHVKDHGVADDTDCRPTGTPCLQRKSPKPTLSNGVDQTHQRLLSVLLTAPTISKAWNAYQDLVTKFPYNPLQKPTIPYGHLHRLARLLASSQPRTRTLYLRLSSVLATLRRTGGHVHTWEWNALIDCAGKHWKKTSMADYKTALDEFQNMTTLPRPAKNPVSSDYLLDDSAPQSSSAVTHLTPAKPDIVTYTTLLSIAGRSKQPSAIRHALKLLRMSGISANRITYLSMLSFYSRINRLSGIRSTLRMMDEQDMELGIDGLNACIWAFASSGRMDVALATYRVLRNNVAPETGPHSSGDDVTTVARYLREVEYVDIPPSLAPDEITYTCLIQCLAYQGHMVQTLNVFLDMLSNRKCYSQAPVIKQVGVPVCYPPSMVVFRAIFLGFCRHAGKPGSVKSGLGLGAPLYGLSAPSPWNLTNLRLVFVAFMNLPKDAIPSERVLYWIMVAFGKLSGDDLQIMREVWEQLEGKYGCGWGNRLERLRKMIYASPRG